VIDAAVREAHRSTKAAPEEYLGPAEVIEARANEVTLSLPGGSTVRAELAFSLPYTPAPKDVLLVIGRGHRHYAIGVLRGSGTTDLALQGDVELRAVNGRLRLTGDRGLSLTAPEVDLTTTALRMIARDVTQRFESLYKRVTSVLRVHAGEAQTLVDEGSFTQAKRAAILTEETVTINGREVHLG
jgi:hypothetical protein